LALENLHSLLIWSALLALSGGFLLYAISMAQALLSQTLLTLMAVSLFFVSLFFTTYYGYQVVKERRWRREIFK